MLAATNETATTVRNTTTFVSTRVASPFIKAMSFAAGVRQAAKTVKQGVAPTESKPAEPPPATPPTDTPPSPTTPPATSPAGTPPPTTGMNDGQ